MSRIKPGDVCLIVGEDVDCLCNIGAMLTVTQPTGGRFDESAWFFKDASRPLKITDVYDKLDIHWLSHSFESEQFDAYMYDRHLVPIRDLDKQDETEKEKEHEVQ